MTPHKTEKVSSILIANRGEIACRIIRTCKRLGIRTVAVFSEADRSSLHVQQADEAYLAGPAESRLSYLNAEKILQIAQQVKADAIHPGYGFLSENHSFASQVRDAGILFIGPTPEAMRLLGDKLSSKTLAARLKIPISPSLTFDASGAPAEKELKDFIKKQGFPLIVKAAGGGGGRGMRKVMSEQELAPALEAAAREAQTFFNDARVFIEKLIAPARHVEVQIIGDAAGNVISLFDRDCTLQRNHQKVVEEAPAPKLSEKFRGEIHRAATQLAKEAGYSNLGTVEFLVTSKEEFYFLEVNSRLQVEHPVTEEILGLDLVELQIRVAEGAQLPRLLPKKITPHAHSIELRICAEIPEKNFASSTGRINEFRFPIVSEISPPCVARVEAGFETGKIVSHYYDSLLAKLIITAPTREEIIKALPMILRRIFIGGVETNLGYLGKITALPEFHSATHAIDSLSRLESPQDDLPQKLSYAAAGVFANLFIGGSSTSSDPWETLSLFRAAGSASPTLFLRGFEYSLDVGAAQITPLSSTISVKIALRDFSRVYEYQALRKEGQVLVAGEAVELRESKGDEFWVNTREGIFCLRKRLENRAGGKSSTSRAEDSLASPLPGKILEITVNEGSQVNQGDSLIVLESMKMEHILRATSQTTISKILVSKGQLVSQGSTLLQFK